MIITTIIYWIGVAHIAAYALAGFSFAFFLFAEWIIARFKLKRDMIRAAHRMFRERNKHKREQA